MAFWGVEVKPGKPFHHPPSDDHGKRLHISQATLGIGTATTRSVVQCNVGENTPVLLCALRPDTAESSQLNLEFQESDEVVFSVLGPLSVHLTGYYVQPPGNEIEPPGEDIASTDDERSASSSNEEDEYEDSFINDSDPGIVPSSPDSGDEAEKDFDRKETKEVKTSRRCLKKKYQLIDSPSKEQRIAKALQPLDHNSEDDLPISSLRKHKHEEEGTVIESETNKMKQREIGDNLTPKQDVPAMEDAEPKSSPPYSNEVASENEAKPKEEEMVPKVVKPLEMVKGLPVPKSEPKNANERKKTRSTIRKNTDPQCGTKAGNLEKDVPLPLPIEENQKQEKSDRAENVKRSKKKRKKHSGEDKVLEAEGLTIESENVKNLLLEPNQGNSKTENDEEHKQDEVKNNNLEDNEAENVRKSKKKRKKFSGETDGATIEGENVKNLLLKTTNEGDSKTENDEKYKGESVDGKFEKKKKRKKLKSKEKVEAVPDGKENFVHTKAFFSCFV